MINERQVGSAPILHTIPLSFGFDGRVLRDGKLLLKLLERDRLFGVSGADKRD